jgi:hypothetical protein
MGVTPSSSVPTVTLPNTYTHTNDEEGTIKVTHPFSPFYGQSFTFIKKASNDGRDRLICVDEAGNIRRFLTAWTDYHSGFTSEEQEKAVSRVSADFRYEDLFELSELLRRLK